MQAKINGASPEKRAEQAEEFNPAKEPKKQRRKKSNAIPWYVRRETAARRFRPTSPSRFY